MKSSSRTRSFRPPPASSFSSKRYNSFAARRRDSLEPKRYLLRWLRRPSTFVVTALCLLFAPTLWFISRTATPAPDGFMDEFADNKPRHLRSSSRQESGEAEAGVLSPLEGVVPPPPPPPPPPRHAAPKKSERSDVPDTKMGAGAVPLPPPPISPKQQPTPAPKKKKKHHSESKKDTTGSPWKPPVLPVEVFRDVPEAECIPSPLLEKRVDPSTYEFGCDEIQEMLMGEKQLIGHGYIRDVYLVDLKGGRKVVVKFVREDYDKRTSDSRIEKIHRWEAAALDAVRGHPNIVGMLGVCGASSVSEYYGIHLDDLVLTPGAKPLPITSVVSMALDMARGLQALHEAPGGPVVHFDIKPQQMMLDSEGRIKINDLNLARFPSADKDQNSCPFRCQASGVDSWRAPENIQGKYLDEKVDVYSMAMVYYTMLALYPPYTDVPDGTGEIMAGNPPTVDPSWHKGFLAIVQDMWHQDPKARPSARRVVQRLEILQQQLAMEKTA